MNTLPLAAKDNSKLEDLNKCWSNCSVKYPSHWTSQSLTNQYINCLDGCNKQHPRGYELNKRRESALNVNWRMYGDTAVHTPRLYGGNTGHTTDAHCKATFDKFNSPDFPLNYCKKASQSECNAAAHAGHPVTHDPSTSCCCYLRG